jgi:hypothetical protein
MGDVGKLKHSWEQKVSEALEETHLEELPFKIEAAELAIVERWCEPHLPDLGEALSLHHSLVVLCLLRSDALTVRRLRIAPFMSTS